MADARDPGGVYFDERLSGVLLEKTLRSCNRVCDLGAPEFVIVDPTIDFPYYYCRLCVPVTRSGAAACRGAAGGELMPSERYHQGGMRIMMITSSDHSRMTNINL